MKKYLSRFSLNTVYSINYYTIFMRHFGFCCLSFSVIDKYRVLVGHIYMPNGKHYGKAGKQPMM